MTTPRHLALAVCLAVSFLAQTAVAQVYRWTDDEGRTVVSDTPPPGKQKVQKVTKGNGNGANPEASAQPSAQALSKDKKSSEQPPKVTLQAAPPDAASCRLAQQSLQTLESGVPMVTKGPDGQQSRLDDAGRAKELARVREFLQSCRY